MQARKIPSEFQTIVRLSCIFLGLCHLPACWTEHFLWPTQWRWRRIKARLPSLRHRHPSKTLLLSSSQRCQRHHSPPRPGLFGHEEWRGAEERSAASSWWCYLLGSTLLVPFQGSLSFSRQGKRNGTSLRASKSTHRSRVVFLSFLEIKDVSNGPEPGLNAVPWMLAHQAGETNLCSTCTDLQVSDGKLCPKREVQLLKSPAGHSHSLQYESKHEDCIIKKILVMGNSQGSPPLASAFLLCLCVQHSMANMSELHRLLLRIASGVQNAVWVSSGQVIGNVSGL